MSKVTVKIEVDETKLNDLGNFCNQQGMVMNIEYVLPFQPTVSPEKKQDAKPNTSKRIGAGVGIIHLPEGFDEAFDEMDAEIEKMFEESEIF